MKLINNIILKIDEFPTLPTVYTKLNEVMAHPNVSAKDVADVVSQDQASAAKVLKVANSPIYGLIGKISTISQAVVYIGFNEVKSIVLALSIIEMFKDVKANSLLDPKDFWRYSFAVGVISRNIANGLQIKNLEGFFINGILHGLGKLLFLKTIPDIYEKILTVSKEKKLPVRKAEEKVLGISHPLAGQMLAEKWRLPKEIQNVIKNLYIGTVNDRYNEMVGIIHVSTIMASMLELGSSGDFVVPKINRQIWNDMKLPEEFFANNYQKMVHEYQDISNLLS